MADVAAKDSGVAPPAVVTTSTSSTTTTDAAAASSPDSAAATSNRSTRRKTARSPSGSTGGHYADPLSPIASTPLKRPRVQTAEKASKPTPSNGGTNSTSSSVKKTPKTDAPSTTTDAFLSPRKLVHEYDADEKPAKDKEKTHGRASPERQTPHDADAPSGDDELFSPVLKPPRATRTSSDTSPATALDAATAFLSSSSTCSELTNDDEDHETAAAAANGTDDDEAKPAAAALDNEDEEEQEDAGVGSDSGSDASELEFNPFYFMKTLPKYEDIVSCPRPIALPAKSRHAPKISLVLDLDETLVHCSVDDVANPHLQFPVTFNGVEYTVKVKKRPHMEYFLTRVAELFEVVVFTASHRAYAETLLNLLDPHRRLIKYRLYRDDCLDVYGNYLKDLNVLGRDLSKVLLVDNSPHAFGYQVGNGVPIETWYDDEADDELLSLLPFLESLIDVDDVRPIVANQFQIQKLIDAAPDDVV